MGLLDVLKGDSVYLDTAPIIYYVENILPYADLLEPVFQEIEAGRLRAITATMTLTETLVVPYRKKDWEIIKKLETLLINTSGLTILSLTPEIAREAAIIRSGSSVKTPDAIQLATARDNGIDYFLTNDKRLNFLPFPQIILLDDFI